MSIIQLVCFGFIGHVKGVKSQSIVRAQPVKDIIEGAYYSIGLNCQKCIR